MSSLQEYSRLVESQTARSAAPRPRPPLSQPGRGLLRRRGWAGVALVLSTAAVIFEAKAHLCASTLFDPLPDIVTGVAYAWVLFFLCFNEATLRAAEDTSTNPLILWLGPKRAAGLSIAGTGVALLAAAMTTWMFLPFLAIAPLLVISGIGALLLAPCLDLIVLVAQFRALRVLWQHETSESWDGRAIVGTVLLGMTAIFMLAVRPLLIGRWTDRALHRTGSAQQQAFSGLRFVHGESAILDLTYRRKPPYWVCLGYKAGTAGVWPWVGYGWDGLWEDVSAARRTYFLLTGSPFESVPRPDSEAHQNSPGQPDGVAVEETGGYVVGRPVPGLSLDSSDLKFTVDAQTETTAGNWTLEFRNDTDLPQEARADILLPPGGTCHQASLWINGVEHQAAFSSPQKVREAYQQIAYVEHRDPLLVTMPAPDHLLAQCFPVPANSTMKIKLGITAPLIWRTGSFDAVRVNGGNWLAWNGPAFGPVNFDVPSRLSHSLSLTTRAGSPIPAPVIRGADIFSPGVLAVPTTRTAPRVGDTLAPGITRTESPLAIDSTPVDLWLLRDASLGTNDLLTPSMQGEIDRVLATLPSGSRVVSEDTLGRNVGSGRTCYAGGTDPAPVLLETLRGARASRAAGRTAIVVFLHAASPANVSDLNGVRHELQKGADDSGPALVSIQLAPRAQDAVAMDLAGFSAVYARHALPGDGPGALADSLRFAVGAAQARSATARTPQATDVTTPLGGQSPAVNGVGFAPLLDSTTDLDALAHLRQASRTTAGWYASNATDDPTKSLNIRIAAGAPAAHAHLITPISSAVVLETHEQYEEKKLKDPDAAKEKDKDAAKPEVPNVNAPEPSAGLLAALGLCLLVGTCRVARIGRR